MKQVLMTMFNLSASAGGITRVMMNRGRMFREEQPNNMYRRKVTCICSNTSARRTKSWTA